MQRKRRSRLALLLASVALIGLAGGCGGSSSPSAAPPPARSFFGIDPQGLLTSGDFARMGRAGVGSFRFPMAWPFVQPTPTGAFKWQPVDQTVAAAARERLDILATLTGTPAWETPGCATCTNEIRIGTPDERANWTRFVGAAVSRYGPDGSFWRRHPSLPSDPITRWQIWNEQNNPVQHNPPDLYANLLALSARTIRSIDPHAEIVLGGMFGTPEGSRRAGVAAWSYLNRLYGAGARRDFDTVALHPYSPSVAGIRYQIDKIRAVMEAHHDARTRTLVTEIGWGSGGGTRHPGTGPRGQVFVVSPSRQAANLTGAFELLQSHRLSWRIGGVYWFTWKDPANPPPGLCAFCYSAGLYAADGRTPKPALAAFERFTSKTTR